MKGDLSEGFGIVTVCPNIVTISSSDKDLSLICCVFTF